jgi:hypothetical protein
MKKAASITQIFNDHVGHEVITLCTREPREITELRALAEKNGLSLRVIYPGEAVTKDYCSTRMNVHLEAVAAKRNRVFRVTGFTTG